MTSSPRSILRMTAMMSVLLAVFVSCASASSPPAAGSETHATHTGDGHDGHAAESPTLFTGDLGNIIWSLATFLFVVIVLGMFAWKPILAGLKKREDFIRDSLQTAKREREASEERLREYTDKLNAARAEASAIVEEGRRDADAVKRKIEETAKAESAAMIERARREITIATETAVKELHTRAANLAIAVASKVIRKQLDPKEHERLLRDSMADLDKVSQN